MSQIYNDNTKRPKPKENQLGILGISSREFTHFAGISAEGLGFRRECCWDYVSLSLRICPKSCYIFPLKVAFMLTLEALTYIEGNGRTGMPI